MVHLLLADDQCLSVELAMKSVPAEIASHLFSEETRQKVKNRQAESMSYDVMTMKAIL